MKVFNVNKLQFLLMRLYFALAIILAVAELFNSDQTIYFLKPILIPTLMALYLSKSVKKNALYVLCLFFALLSNVSFMFPTKTFVVYGFIAFMLYRIVSIILVWKLVQKIYILPFVVATIPFLFIFLCLLNLTLGTNAPEFYPALVNAVLISALSGISLSNYVMSDNKVNSWLAISTLLFVFLVFLFMIQKYYISNIVFQPISALIFSCGHYAFYKFMIEAEKPSESELTQ